MAKECACGKLTENAGGRCVGCLDGIAMQQSALCGSESALRLPNRKSRARTGKTGKVFKSPAVGKSFMQYHGSGWNN